MMLETGHNRRAKRYALEICQWLDGILKDESVDECIEYEMNNTVEGLSRQLLEVKRSNQEYKKELEELNSKYLEMSEYLSVKSKLQEMIREYDEYKSDCEQRIYQLERRNDELQEERTRLELRGRSLEESNREVLRKNEELIREIRDKGKEIDQKVYESVEREQEYLRKEAENRSMLERASVDKSELEDRCRRLEEQLRVQERDLREDFRREIGEKELRIQNLNEECLHNKYRITELEKLLKMAENEQLVTKNYRSLIEQYKSRLLVLESSEKSYVELQEKWSSQEKLFKQQSQKLEQAEGWLKRMVELEQENSALSQQIKQWETMAFRYTHNLKVLNRESAGGQIKDESDDLDKDSHGEQEILEAASDLKNERRTISPTSVLSAIFEFQRRYQDVLVSKTVIETSKLELENKVDMLESKLQVCQREIKYYEDELSSRSEEMQRVLEGKKLLECEIKVLKECLSKEGKSVQGRGLDPLRDQGEVVTAGGGSLDVNGQSSGVDKFDRVLGGSVSAGVDSGREYEGGEGSDWVSRVEAQKKDLEEKMKMITHLENELKLRNDEIKTYWSIRVAYDTLTQERDSLLESSNSLQEYNKELKSQIASLSEKLKRYDQPISAHGESKLSQDKNQSCEEFGSVETFVGEEQRVDDLGDSESYSALKDKYLEEQRRSQTLSEYYIKERSDLVDAISNILGWRIEIIYVEGGLTAYKLSNIFSNHGGEFIFVIRPAPALGDGGVTGAVGGLSNAVTTTFLLTNENMASEAEMEEQLTLDFIGYYASKFEEDSNWALQLTATQSYPAFMAYTCLEEFHSTNAEAQAQTDQSPNVPPNPVEQSSSEKEATDLKETGIIAKTKRLREDTSWIHPRE
ncbi:coiled coil-containing protein [Cryptosporidium canis]|uniref:Coiled coil-containing protein n=1 Tax=Cryptosporidium canis TaxID=195482 RepID=A0ABQ8P8P3_9CRYT|nr:coiled coil-containing protein [Cryptosporidium canis]